MDMTKTNRAAPATALAMAAVLGIALTGSAMASGDDSATEYRAGSQLVTAGATSNGTLDTTGIVAALQAQGYHDFREVERDDDGTYEVKARDASGRRVELYVDARSGDILRSEADD